MTKLDNYLTEVEARLEKTSAEPWAKVKVGATEKMGIAVHGKPWSRGGRIAEVHNAEDWDFLFHAQSDIVRLSRIVRRLREQLTHAPHHIYQMDPCLFKIINCEPCKALEYDGTEDA